jgi:ubiquinone/menaquinone biosynthesis C-methylase UbiE/Flp pilus assembly protein TadD
MPASESKAKDPSTELVELLQRALNHQKNKEMDQAETLFKKALKDHPENPDVLQIAAIFFDQIENYTRSQKLLEKVIIKKPNDFGVNKLLGKALFHNGEYELAKLRLQKTLALNIEDAEANALLGQCLFKMGNSQAAAGFFDSSLKKKDSVFVLNLLAQSLMFLNKENEACEMLDEAIKKNKFNYDTLILSAMTHSLGTLKSYKLLVNAMSLDPARDEAKTLFAVPLNMEGIPEAVNEIVADVVWLCLQSKNVNHDNLVTLWARQVFIGPINKKNSELYEAKTYDEFQLLYNQIEYRKNLLKPLFLEGTKKIRSFGLQLETLFSNLRRFYLFKINNHETLEDIETELLSALAEQSFSNEFVFNESPEEAIVIEDFKSQIQKSSTQFQLILAYAVYRPLRSLNNSHKIFQSRVSAPTWLQSTLYTHIGQIQEENEIKKTIKKLDKIDDGISKKVQEQYEENPYPRWRSANFIILPAHKVIAPKYKIKDKVLIAGCGTGQHIFHTFVANPHSEITAIDLSSSSLAYAIKKTREYGIKNVRFFQADILKLSKLSQSFDRIECMGVLHHMKDPEAGLKALLNLLKKDGEIALGLYSETARKDVVTARKIISEQGFPPTVEGIRACRDYIKAHADKFSFLIGSADFYSTSAIRDLIFHVQERRYTLEEIKKLLQDNNLRFDKFKLSNARIAQYKAAYPDDITENNLENWAELEQKDTSIFANMYQFSAIKL